MLESRRLLILLTISLCACASGGRLAEYDFSSAATTARVELTPFPDFESPAKVNYGFTDRRESDGTVVMRVDAATKRIIEIFTRAANEASVGNRIESYILAEGTRVLGGHPATGGEAARFRFDVQVEKYGLYQAQSRTTLFQFEMEGTLRLVDQWSERAIWEAGADHRVPLTAIENRSTTSTQLMGHEVLSEIKEEDLKTGLEQLADGFREKLVGKLESALGAYR